MKKQEDEWEKWFPSDHNLTRINKEGKEVSTFLADKSIDSFIFAYLLERSYGINGKTIVKKKDLPSQLKMAEETNLTRSTFNRHFTKLRKSEYVIETEEYFELLPQTENFHFKLPLKTLKAINKGLKDDVFKVYIFLGSHEIGYNFTLTELGKHTGAGNMQGNSKPYEDLWYRLYFLQKLGLINLSQYYDEKGRPHMKLEGISKDLDNPIRGFEDREWTRQDGARSIEEIIAEKESNYR